jgi:hypothetical protein
MVTTRAASVGRLSSGSVGPVPFQPRTRFAWSPDVDADDHRLRLQCPDHGDGHEHDEPRRVLRTATVGQRHQRRNTVTPVELAAGATRTLTATLSPTAAAGSAVNGTPSVIDATDWGGFDPIGFPASASDFHDFAYAHTVGS